MNRNEMTEGQKERQKKCYRSKGKYSTMNECEVCGHGAGMNYCSLPGSGAKGTGLVLCRKCCDKYTEEEIMLKLSKKYGTIFNVIKEIK